MVGKDLTLVTQTLQNLGAIQAKNNLLLNAQTLTNEHTGVISSENVARVNVANTLTNRGLWMLKRTISLPIL